MADKRISELTTVVTTANDADYVAVDGTGGTDATKRILVNDFESQIRNGLSDAELAILDGATLSTSELNVLDGITASTGELNILNGATITVSELNVLDGITATTVEINKLDGFTGTTTELNTLDGITATTDELNKLDGFTGDYEDLNYAESLNDTGVSESEFEELKGVTEPLSGLNQALEQNNVKVTATNYTATRAGYYALDTASNVINVSLPITTQLNAGAPMLFVNTAGTNNAIISCDPLDLFSFMKDSGTQSTGTTITLSGQGSCVYIIPSGSTNRYLLILGGFGATIS